MLMVVSIGRDSKGRRGFLWFLRCRVRCLGRGFLIDCKIMVEKDLGLLLRLLLLLLLGFLLC